MAINRYCISMDDDAWEVREDITRDQEILIFRGTQAGAVDIQYIVRALRERLIEWFFIVWENLCHRMADLTPIVSGI